MAVEDGKGVSSAAKAAARRAKAAKDKKNITGGIGAAIVKIALSLALVLAAILVAQLCES